MSTFKKTYLKITNPNANVYWLHDIKGVEDILTAEVKSENVGKSVWPFVCNGPSIADGKTYYYCLAYNGHFSEDDVEIITREEYIKETLNKEISKVRISDEAKEMVLSNFLCELHKAIINSVNIINANDYYNIPEWIKSTRMSFIKCNPSEIYFAHCDRNNSGVDVEMWIKCSRPGIFIGKGGENINYWESLLQAYIDKWCEARNYRQIKMGVRIEEKDLFKYESSVLSL